jgi:glutamine amidotransferase
MCRLFGLHAGRDPVVARFWLLDAPDSLITQSHRNPDGYGLGTFLPDGTPQLRREPVAAFEALPFEAEAHAARSAVFLAHVRYASVGALSTENTHPFEMDGRLFGHNGVVGDLEAVDGRLGPQTAELVQGTTDSERFFALVTQAIREHDGDVRAGIRDATRWLAATVPLYSLNFILATRADLWALRYPEGNELWIHERHPSVSATRALEKDSPEGTMHFHSDQAGDRPVVVMASERMDENPAWRSVEPGTLVHVDADLTVTEELILPDPPAHLMELTGRAADSQNQER